MINTGAYVNQQGGLELGLNVINTQALPEIKNRWTHTLTHAAVIAAFPGMKYT